MSLKDIEIKQSYDSNDDDVINDFYVPVLSQAKYYDRIAGFFTSSSLTISLKGIINIVENNGKIRMLVCPRLNREDALIINNAIENPELYISDLLYKELMENEDHIFNEYRNLMAHLVAKKIMEIKVVLVKENGRYLDGDEIDKTAIFHQKVGIIKDNEFNCLSFSGSINETFNAWNENIEEFKTFKSWDEGQKSYCESDQKKFNDYWFGYKAKTETMDLPKAINDKFIELANSTDFCNIKEKIKTRTKNKKNNLYDSLFWYQKEAVDKWMNTNKQMLFSMATGTGKTRTALACMEKLVNTESVLIIVATPQSTLSKQWMKEIKKLSLDFGPLLICDSSYQYKDKLSEIISKFNLGLYKKAVLLTTHATASSNFFINSICNGLKMNKTSILFVGDEAHGLGSKMQRKALSNLYKYRIGLSATPSRWYDDEGSKLLLEYFNNSYEFGIEKAIKTINPITGKSFLTPYNYYPIPIYLTSNENDEYNKMTTQLSKLHGDDEETKEHKERILQRRADIIKEAENKVSALKELLMSLMDKGKICNTLIFTSPKHLVPTINILSELDISASPLTDDQGNVPRPEYGGLTEREQIISDFKKGNYQVIVAIKCMDEGIDIPSADTAILMSSTTNPREYIQRIGRVIRRYENKEFANIYDLVAKSEDLDVNKSIQRNELRRERYIADLAKNTIEAINKIYD